MVILTDIIPRLAEILGLPPGELERRYRRLREDGQVPAGTRGRAGAPPDIAAPEVATLLLSVLASDSVNGCPEPTAQVSAYRRVGEAAGFQGSLHDRLVDLMARLDWAGRLNDMPVPSVAVCQSFGGVEWAEVRFFVPNSVSTFHGGAHDFNMREVYAAGLDAITKDVIGGQVYRGAERFVSGQDIAALGALVNGAE